jgi:glutathione S-transferase
MRILYIANKNYSSWSLRPWVLMRELGLEFEERLVPFEAASASNWAAFRSFSPSGRVPCLHDGNQVVWDSLAITEYLAEQYPKVWPSDREARAWARCAAAEMHSGFSALRQQCSMHVGYRIAMAAISAPLKSDLDRLNELWGEGLRRHGGPWLAGAAFTAVDAFFAPVAFRIQTYQLPLGDASLAYARRLLELPSMQDWAEAALREPWTDPAHDADSLAAGPLLHDHRHFARRGA